LQAPIKVLASVLGVVNGAWAVYIALSATNTAMLTTCVAKGCEAMFVYVPFAQALAVGGVLLIIVSIVSLKGFRWSLLLEAVLSLAVLGFVAIEWGAYGSASWTSAILSIVAAAVSVYASRRVREIPDQAHPLNLPVFG